MNRPILFYDGGCPLCRKEIAHYQRLDRSAAIDWVDLSTQSERLEPWGLSYAKAMRLIHAVDSAGTLCVGVDAFVLVWRELPYYRHLASLVTGLRLVPLLNWAYYRFANWRFRRRCRDGVCLTEE